MRLYEMFTMKEEEIIDKMFERFQPFLIVWEPRSITIQEACNMKTLTLNELFGGLRVHEKKKLATKGPLALKTRESSSKKVEEKRLKAFKAKASGASDGII
ncbi:hypothetical protein CR513_28558, partial [Mucuna pruriens]